MVEKRKVEEDEIDLIELIKTIWNGRIFIIKLTGAFIILGLVIAFTRPVEYVAYCKLLPESQEGTSNQLAGLGGLAGLAGIEIGTMSKSGVLSPQLYPEIVHSLPFTLEVLNDTVYFESINLNTTPFYYFKEVVEPSLITTLLEYTVGLPWVIKGFFFDSKEAPSDVTAFYRFSKEDWKIIESFKQRVVINLDELSGVVSIKVEMPDAYAAAALTKKIELMVTNAVIKYKTDKSLSNLKFIKKSFSESRNEFTQVQHELAILTDRNKNVSSAIAEIELRNVENEYNIAFEVYKGLASQVEQAKLKLKEETPVFTILEPIRIPEDKESPKRGLILLGMCFFGVVLSVIILVIKFFIKLYLNKA